MYRGVVTVPGIFRLAVLFKCFLEQVGGNVPSTKRARVLRVLLNVEIWIGFNRRGNIVFDVEAVENPRIARNSGVKMARA